MKRTYSHILLCILCFLTISGIELLPVQAEEKQVTVCVLDSGCSMEDADGWNYLDDSADISDENGHGTMICEILEEKAPDTDVIMLKCFAEESESASSEEKIIQAIYDSVDNYHADIINMSWTLNKDSDPLHKAIQYAAENGVVLVAAAGNLSFQTPLGSLTYPAGWEEVIGVGGMDFDQEGNPADSLWYLSSEAVFVSADGNYEGEKGSSFAVPRVTAVIADYIQENPEADLEMVCGYLKKISVDAGEEGYDTVFGWGYIE